MELLLQNRFLRKKLFHDLNLATKAIITIQTKKIFEMIKPEKIRCSEIKCNILQIFGQFIEVQCCIIYEIPKVEYSKNDEIILKLTLLFQLQGKESICCSMGNVNENNHFSCFRRHCKEYEKRK